MTQLESPSRSGETHESPIRLALKNTTRKDLSACLRDIEAKMISGEIDSKGNTPSMIRLRKLIYEWEKALYDEPKGTKYHRKFVRNYLLQLESGFEDSSRSKTGAKGLMQLTGDVLDDMQKRSPLFRKQMRKIGVSHDVNKLLPPDMQAIITKVVKKPDVAVDISPLVQYFRTGPGRDLLAKNGVMNAYIGTIYFGVLSESVNMESTMSEIQIYESIADKLRYPKLNELIKNRLLMIDPNPGSVEKIPALTRETYLIFLDTLKQNPSLRQSLFAARRYNGSLRKEGFEKYGIDIMEKDVYFIVIGYATTMSMLTNKNYRAAYCQDDKKQS